jgi:hypothetical protein
MFPQHQGNRGRNLVTFILEEAWNVGGRLNDKGFHLPGAITEAYAKMIGPNACKELYDLIKDLSSYLSQAVEDISLSAEVCHFDSSI